MKPGLAFRRTPYQPLFPAGLLLAVLAVGSAFGATTIVSDNYTVTTTTTGFALNSGVNYGINPPTTRLTGAAVADLRYFYTTTGQRATSKYGINGNKLRSLDANGIGRFTLSADGASPFDFSAALGTTGATPADPVVYEVKIGMRNDSTGTERLSFGLSTAEGDVTTLDFGIQVYRATSGDDFYTVQRRIDNGSSGAGDINEVTLTMDAGTGGSMVNFLIRVTDAGAESDANYNSRVQVSIDNGSTWIYDTRTDTTILPNGWRLDAAGRYFVWDQAPNAASIYYDNFSVRVLSQAVWNGGATADDNWSRANNWSGEELALSGEDILFAGSTRLTPYMDTDYSVRNVQFDRDAAAFVIGAAAGTTLTVTGDILQNAANEQTLGLPISIASPCTINTASGDLTISGAISGTGGIAKSGEGALTLGEANTYGGDTTVSAGALLVNGSIGSGAVTVQDTATLGGAGTIGGNVTVEEGGSLSPGTSIGTLTVNGDLTFESGSTATVEVDRSGPSSDVVTGIGTLTMGGTLEAANNGAALEAGDAFTLLSATTKTGEFAAISPANPNSDEALAWDTPHLRDNGILRVHRSPDASDKTVTRPRDLSVKISWSDLFDSTDADNDPVVLESFTASVKGATITSNATYLFYDLPGSNDADEFYYTATDNRGGKRTKKITVQVSTDPVTGQAQQITVVGGQATVGFAGIPGARYDVQRATDANFTQNVTTVLSTNAPAGGVFLLVEEPGLPQAYYRLKYPGTPAP